MDRELMDVEKLITETFTAHEHVAPDGDRVLAAARERIDRRRTVLSRPLAVAAGVVALTLAAATVVVLTRSGSNLTNGVAAPAGESQVSGPAIADLPMPFSLEWLPEGKVDYLAHRINIGAAADDLDTPVYGGEYLLTVTTGGHVLEVAASQVAMPATDAVFKSGPGWPVTINGQPGIESASPGGPAGYELYVANPGGGSMYVGVSGQRGASVPEEQLVAAGRKIAENIRVPGTTSVTPVFGFRDLPSGLRICAFDVGGVSEFRSEPSTSYSLGACDTMPPVHVSTSGPAEPASTPGQPVQGHATRYLDDAGYHRLWVLDAVNGVPVHVAGKVPVADLYDIANRLVLPS